ncbi:putative lipoprotein [Myxococcus hansupus]|uniref:Putative lipoprotein n=1 Tax=Pseudomyxococcus hansupus TaxID=1297742 RepID=A0A0H4WXK6_9BACT|nr:putative lipoprotein [Myxococcus hansupus]
MTGQDDALAQQESAATSAALDGCIYSISAYPQPGVTPTVYDIRLFRQPIPTCAYGFGTVTLGTSVVYEPTRSVAINALGIAASYTRKSSVSGSAPITLSVHHVDPATLAVIRTNSLGVHLGAGNIVSENVAIAADGTTVTVSGTKTGVIWGESGSGSRYTASFPNFFTSTTAPTVAAFP